MVSGEIEYQVSDLVAPGLSAHLQVGGTAGESLLVL